MIIKLQLNTRISPDFLCKVKSVLFFDLSDREKASITVAASEMKCQGVDLSETFAPG